MNTKLFELFINHTNEKKVILDKIIEIVKPNKSMKFLDCGCGTGEITIPLSKLVKSTLAVDMDNSILKKISKKDNIKFIKKKIEDLDLKEKFDFALLSYIWHNIKFEEWPKIILKILSYLKKNDILILISYGESEGKLEQIIGPKIGFKPSGGGKKLIDVLNNMGLKFKDYKLKTTTWADNIDQMFKIESCFFENKLDEFCKLEKEIKEYLKKFRRGNKIIIHATAHMLVIRNFTQK